jgi:glycerol kinase
MAQYILALDQGSTSSRTIIFDEKGSIICAAQKELIKGWQYGNQQQ